MWVKFLGGRSSKKLNSFLGDTSTIRYLIDHSLFSVGSSEAECVLTAKLECIAQGTPYCIVIHILNVYFY